MTKGISFKKAEKRLKIFNKIMKQVKKVGKGIKVET